MRIILVVGFAILCGTATAQAATGTSWCYRDFGSSQAANCGYPSARQCLAFAGIAGGVCERESAVPARRAPAKKQVSR